MTPMLPPAARQSPSSASFEAPDGGAPASRSVSERAGPERSGLERADLLVVGGLIRSFHPGAVPAEAMAVRGGRIVAIGGREIASRFEAERTLDLGGRTVVPGLIDAHAHFLGLGRREGEIDLRGLTSHDAVLAKVRAAVAAAAPGEMIRGRGWNQELWPGGQMLTEGPLSAASPDHPVLLRRVDGHATLANARAMQAAGITAATVAPPGGEILRDASGRPTGVFIDAACDLLPKPPAPAAGQRERWALAAQAACLAAGLTCVHDAGVDEESLATFESLLARGRLVLRLNVMLEGQFDERDEPLPWLARRLARGVVAGAHDGRLSVSAIKIYADGALGSRGAALLAPYSDRCCTSGLMQMSPASLAARVRAARAAGFQAAVHGIGDAANRAALDAFEAARDAATPARAFRLEHAQVLSPEDIPRVPRLGVVASMQPTHATSDMNMAPERLGLERLRGAYAWRTLLDAGAHLAFGSDFPIENENPFWGIFAATERTDLRGQPRGGWMPEQKVTREEAWRAFTFDAARAGLDEDRTGSLQPGLFADFLVLPLDPMTCSPEQLRDLRPDATHVAGRPVHGEGA